MSALALSLNFQTPDLYEVQVKQLPSLLCVDNGSDPPIPNAFIRHEINGHFSVGWNLAVREVYGRTRAKWLWLVNSDVMLISHVMLAGLVRVAEDKELVMITPAVLRSQWPAMWSSDYREVDFIDCVAPLINVEWFLKHGGFDENLPGLGADLELCWRTRKDAKAVDGQFLVHHPYHETVRRVKDTVMFRYKETCDYLVSKHGDKIVKWQPGFFASYVQK